MTTQLNSKLITLNCNRKQKRTLRQKGFTLIELMVVTAVAGVLGAVAVPKFLGARDLASAKAEIAAAIGVGKECQTWIKSGGESLSEAPEGGSGQTVDCGDPSAAGSVTSAPFKALPDTETAGFPGLKCLEAKSAGGETSVVISVSDVGTATCAFETGSASGSTSDSTNS